MDGDNPQNEPYHRRAGRSWNPGVLMLTDMFGGTPSNIAFSFHEPGKVEAICHWSLVIGH
jgi:mannose/fructose-specific phosphotransferase system component IIA